MAKRMLIDATHPEETRVVILSGSRLEEFDFETSTKKQVKGNIYLAKVTRVEPSLQAAFVEYGGNRHGFLAFSEIHPDYYRIPVADREALLAEQAAEDDDDEEFEAEPRRRQRRPRRGERRDGGREARGGREAEEAAEAAPADDAGWDHRPRGQREDDGAPTDEQDGGHGEPYSDDRNDGAQADEQRAETEQRVEGDRADGNPADAEPAGEENPDGESPDRPRRPPAMPATDGLRVPTLRSEPVGDSPAAAGADSVAAADAIPAGQTDAVAESAPIAELPAAEPVAAEGVTDDVQAADPVDSDASVPSDEATLVDAEPVAGHSGAEDLVAAGGYEAAGYDAAAGQGDEEPAGDEIAAEPVTDEHGEIAPAPSAEEEAERSEAAAAIETLGGDELEDVRRRRQRNTRQYKIQEVIKRRQIMLVQVTKEERGNKGAALTTFLSLAGRYCVLMPNAGRSGGGVSRKIVNPVDRRRLKSLIEEMQLPDGMSVIVRTAGSERSRAEIKRDLEYLLRLWDEIRDLTMQSTAPALVYEEGKLIKRAIRDLYSRDIEEILVEGEEAYREAKDFMRMLMPSHAKRVQPYRDPGIPLFNRFQIDQQIDAIHSPVVQLKSGGYIVINPTEALVAIDVNSGRSTRERNIEETAYRTNLEAADEIARQLRLRDLAGLIVIDFIDMEEGRNQHAVERRLKEAMKVDRARIQIGRISPFGLLELSRQRLRPSIFETSTQPCPHCGGTGHIRSTESTALHVLRAIEEEGLRRRSAEIRVTVPTQVALYVLNQKRAALSDIERRYAFDVIIDRDDELIPPDYRLERLRVRAASEAPPLPQPLPIVPEDDDLDIVDEEAAEDEAEDQVDEKSEAQDTRSNDSRAAESRSAEGEAGEEEDGGRRRRRRRRRRDERGHGDERGQDQEAAAADEQGSGEAPHADAEDGTVAPLAGEAPPAAEEDSDEDEDGAEGQAEAGGDDEDQQARRRRRRGRRGGRRRTRREDEGQAEGESQPGEDGEPAPRAAEPAERPPVAPAPAPRPVIAMPLDPRAAVEALFEAMESREEARKAPVRAEPAPVAGEAGERGPDEPVPVTAEPVPVPAEAAVEDPWRQQLAPPEYPASPAATEAPAEVAAAEANPVDAPITEAPAAQEAVTEPAQAEQAPVAESAPDTVAPDTAAPAAEAASTEAPAVALPLLVPAEPTVPEAPAAAPAPAEPPPPPRKGWWQRLVETN